jgi:hypothetical protein
MEMMFGSFRFLVEKEGAHRFLAPIFSGLLEAEHESSRSSTSSIELGEDETSPPHAIKPADSGKLADQFGGLTIGSTTGTDLRWGNISNSFTNSTSSSDSEEVFTDQCDGVTYPLYNMGVSSPIPLMNSITQYPELDDSADSTRHQICVLTTSGHEVEEDEQFETFDALGNPYVDPADLTRGT